jgi:hypothetical protein
MKRQSIVLLGVLIFPALGGCEGITPPDRDITAPIQTDATFYSLHEDWVGLATEIPLRFENQTANTLYIVNCRGQLSPVLEKKVGRGWERFWTPVLRACLGPPIVIEPGGVLADTLHVWGALPGSNAGPEFGSDDVEGVYRIVLQNVVFNYDEDQRGLGDPVPLEYRVSNLFVLDDPRR